MDMKFVHKYISCVICVIVFISGLALTGCMSKNQETLPAEKNCTCSFEDYQIQQNENLKEHKDDIHDGDNLYPPVIYYNGHLYWYYSLENKVKKIPKNYSLIGTAQCIILDGLTLPNKQLESNLVKWGSNIYGNGKDEYLYVKEDGEISVFVNETLLE